jgi:beta-lactamase superfamily II metal-dependent hydrolase
MKRLTMVCLIALALVASAGAANDLQIYFIDVEGGQSTLLVTPTGKALLIDTGYAGNGDRDVQRILAAARDARVTQIDYLVTTHFHSDHDGGAPALVAKMPVKTFIDYGSPVQTERNVIDPFEAYAEARKSGRHLVTKPGDRLPITGVDVDVVSAGGLTVAKPLAGAGQPNPSCGSLERQKDDPSENARSLGVRVRYGRFRFLDLGDLTWNTIAKLVCPNDLIGRVDVYLLPHHGNPDADGSPLYAAIRPRVAILNNGATKGGLPEIFATLRRRPGLEAVWQLHRSENAGAVNFADEYIANLDERHDGGYWIKLTASEDGGFTVTNARTGALRRYGAAPDGAKN